MIAEESSFADVVEEEIQRQRVLEREFNDRIANEDRVSMAQTKILKEVKVELRRQIEKWSVQNHTLQEWAGIEGEEFGEACAEGNKAYFLGKEVNEVNFLFGDYGENADVIEELTHRQNRHLDNAREEWVHVAAVAIAIVENIDRMREDR